MSQQCLAAVVVCRHLWVFFERARIRQPPREVLARVEVLQERADGGEVIVWQVYLLELIPPEGNRALTNHIRDAMPRKALKKQQE